MRRPVSLLLLSLFACDNGELTNEELNTRVMAMQGLVDDLNDQVLEAQRRLDELDEVAARVVVEDTTIKVSSVDELEAAVDWLDGQMISRHATVTIDLAPGAYSLSDTLFIDHSDGSRVYIVGEEDDPSMVELRFPQGVTGVEVKRGRALGKLVGLTLVGHGKDDGDDAMGIAVRNNGYLYCGPATDGGAGVLVRDFSGNGVYAESGSVLLADGVESTNNGASGFRVSEGAYLEADGALAADNADYGFRATTGGTLVGEAATARTNTVGFVADGGANLIVNRSTAQGNADTGFYARRGSTLIVLGDETYPESENPRAIENGGSGLVADQGSFISFTDGAINDNGYAPISSNGDGVFAGVGSAVYLNTVAVLTNGANGLQAESGSTIRALGVTLTGNDGGSSSPRASTDDEDGATITE